jgi:hypothetical protein
MVVVRGFRASSESSPAGYREGYHTRFLLLLGTYVLLHRPHTKQELENTHTQYRPDHWHQKSKIKNQYIRRYYQLVLGRNCFSLFN